MFVINASEWNDLPEIIKWKLIEKAFNLQQNVDENEIQYEMVKEQY